MRDSVFHVCFGPSRLMAHIVGALRWTCLIGAALLATATFAKTIAPEPALPRAFFLDDANLGEGEDAGLLLYEAARSEVFPSVQFTKRWQTLDAAGGLEKQLTTFRLQAIQDFKICQSAQLPEFGHFENVSTTRSTKPLLFQPARFDHELVAGRCVLAYPIEAPTAPVRVTLEERNFLLQLEGSAAPLAQAGTLLELWQVFGLTRPTSYDLWSSNGMVRAPDRLSDSDLVRALKAGGEMQRAALTVIAARMTDKPAPAVHGSAPLLGDPRKRVRTRYPPTSGRVASAILESEALLSDKRRWLAMNAIISAAPTAQADRILDQLFVALDKTPADTRSDAEKAWQERVEAKLGERVFDGLEGARRRALELASDLVLTLGGKAPRMFAARYEATIRKMLLTQLSVDHTIATVAARSDFRDGLVLEFLDQVDGDTRLPPIIQQRIEILFLDGPKLSNRLSETVARRCTPSGSFFPNGDQKKSRELCAQLTAKGNR